MFLKKREFAKIKFRQREAARRREMRGRKGSRKGQIPSPRNSDSPRSLAEAKYGKPPIWLNYQKE